MTNKDRQKQLLIEIMRGDEEAGLYNNTMTEEQKEIESLKFRVSQLEMHMANIQRKDFEAKEEIKEQVKRSQRDMDQVEKLAGG